MSQSICKVTSILCLVFSSVVPQSWAQDCIDPPAGLLSWWPGDGDADDVEGPNTGMLPWCRWLETCC